MMFIYFAGILSEEHFSVEQIIHCIRVSENPQTHHHALSLLAIGAKLFPVSLLLTVHKFYVYIPPPPPFCLVSSLITIFQ
jgi:hypothetical protein